MDFSPETDANDAWQQRYDIAVYRFAEELKALHQGNPWPETSVISQAMAYLMTELWDKGFSQTEIRTAFEAAMADMPRYAAGQEQRP